jgi:UDP-sugar diphosphatase
MASDKIEIISLTPIKDPKYVKTRFMVFEQNGVRKDWEVAETLDSVAILIYHRDRDAFVLVKQFRPAVYLKNADGFTYELCAGLVDKDKSLEMIAKEEIREECGYEVDEKSIEKITSFRTAVGFAGSLQTLYFVEVDEDMRVDEGGGIDDEMIEVVYLPVKEAKEFIFDESIVKTPGLMFAFMWFFEERS